MSDVVLLYTTWPDAETAEAFAAEVVADRLAACANVLGAIRSVYRWQGAIERSVETPMLLKTSAAAAEALKARLVERHPYETPCVLALPVDRARSHAGFVDWILDEAVGPGEDAS
ncbi:divalent-cation tolerance protein CutA [Caulobacter sp. 17J65-9]|uniref:divalent-cation tolerance protein CutA n=1 Tax=Caulobacter sp. 17J65-9 TaxID=2709382 RepID=UPI0013C6E344|nr:divalent-cation tolerance protein CutA [Caulobacter sp. 17J65-9]NEX91460.1 divalent-cation tolerance protein CutA [Caulobacter sp. 17J65-9]